MVNVDPFPSPSLAAWTVSMDFDNVLDDGQSEAEATETPGVGLRVPVKDIRQKGLSNSCSGVAHFNGGEGIVQRHTNLDQAASRCELDSIRQ